MSGAAPDVSIVIVSYNTVDLLRDCLRSIAAAAEPFTHETFVVDNQSRDGSADMVEREFPSVRLIRAPRNLGFAAGNNAAFALATGRLVYCLNPDTVSHPGSLATLVRVLDGDPAIGFVGPKLLNADGSHQLSAYRFHTVLSGFFSWSMLGLDRRFPRSRHCLSMHHLHGCDTAFDADWLTGAAILARRSVIDRVGGFDEGYFVYAEEIEWCWRMQRAGAPGRYEPASVVTHIRAASTSHLDDSHAFHGHDPRLLIESHRRLARQTLGVPGAALSQALHLLGVSLAWARNLPPLPGRNPATRRRAWLWMRYLLTPTRRQGR
jgi:hypothetical protein